MCKEKFAKQIDRAVFPGMQGGPHNHVTAAKAVAFAEALRPEFVTYSKQVIANAKAMSSEFISLGYSIVSGGTDNHLFILDLSDNDLSGKEAEELLEKVGISVSRSTIPNDKRPPLNPSGLRIGTPAITTRGMKENEAKLIVSYIDQAFKGKGEESVLAEIKVKVKELCLKFKI